MAVILILIVLSMENSLSEAKTDEFPCIFPASKEIGVSETSSLLTASSSGESDELPPEEESSQYNARRRWSVICKSSMTSGHWSEPDVTDGLGRHLEGPEDSMGRALAGKDA